MIKIRTLNKHPFLYRMSVEVFGRSVDFGLSHVELAQGIEKTKKWMAEVTSTVLAFRPLGKKPRSSKGKAVSGTTEG